MSYLFPVKSRRANNCILEVGKSWPPRASRGCSDVVWRWLWGAGQGAFWRGIAARAMSWTHMNQSTVIVETKWQMTTLWYLLFGPKVLWYGSEQNIGRIYTIGRLRRLDASNVWSFIRSNTGHTLLRRLKFKFTILLERDWDLIPNRLGSSETDLREVNRLI